MQKVTILGASGSIGQSALEVIDVNSDKYEVYALVAKQNADKMLALALKYKPKYVALFDKGKAYQLQALLKAHKCSSIVLAGEDDILKLCADTDVDFVIAAIVGAAGLKPALEAIKASRTVLLANKEALVMSGQVFFDNVKQYHARILPLDSEHSAIFQCLTEKTQLNLGFCDLQSIGVNKIILTGSGGPFRTLDLKKLADVSVEDTINHPVWSMGPKISVDSATMMNKGLEFIEARYLFNASFEQMQVLLHPQSIIHSMVSYIDGAVIAQLGNPSMQTPIARALAYPQRIATKVEALDFAKLKSLTFEEVDFNRYPCLKLAMQASLHGQGATSALNAANEVAVASFLAKQIKFLDIYKICSQVLDKYANASVYSIDEILDLDLQVRSYAQRIIAHD